MYRLEKTVAIMLSLMFVLVGFQNCAPVYKGYLSKQAAKDISPQIVDSDIH